jgi:hypothetical protein
MYVESLLTGDAKVEKEASPAAGGLGMTDGDGSPLCYGLDISEVFVSKCLPWALMDASRSKGNRKGITGRDLKTICSAFKCQSGFYIQCLIILYLE